MVIKHNQFVPRQDTIRTHITSSDTRHSNMTPAPAPGQELFGWFFETWLRKQNRDLESLIALVRAKPDQSEESLTEWTRSVAELVSRVMGHYENYYRVKSESVKKDAVQMMTPAWRSNLEDTFLWIGGWRPTMAFHLLYSISGMQLEAGLDELLSGLSTGDLAELTGSQLDKIDELQRRTIKEGKLLAESLAAHQETVADTSMVELSHLATELTRDPDSAARGEPVGDRVDSALAGKEVELEKILREADGLRLRTLKDVVAILGPVQAAHFLIGAAELHLRIHEWGQKKDGNANGNRNGNGVVRPGNGVIGHRRSM